MSKIDEILSDYAEAIGSYVNFGSPFNSDEDNIAGAEALYQTSHNEAKQALYEDMLELIGEDEPVDLENMRGYKDVFGEDSKEYQEMFATYQANMVKQYYRTKLKEYYGVEE